MKISVIIPMYNSRKTIKRAINSVLEQTYSGLIEILVINDGSTDGSDLFIHEIISNNKTDRIVKIVNKENAGVSSARNLGVTQSSGEYIAFLDSDDAWHPQKLELQVSFMKENKIKFSGTFSKVLYDNEFEEHQLIHYSSARYKKISFYSMLIISPFPTPSVIIHNSLKHELFDDGMRFSEDYDLWLRLSYQNKTIKLLEPLTYTFKHDYLSESGSLSTNLKAMQLGVEQSFRKMLKLDEIKLLDKLLIFLALYFSKIKYLRRLFLSRQIKRKSK